MVNPTDDYDIRVITCPACGGDRGHMDYDERWRGCTACGEEGEYEVKLQPIDCFDLTDAHGC
jgi:hypothetical protein